MKPIVVTARQDAGTLHIRNKRHFDRQIAALKDGPYTITIERVHATRSLASNALYWGVYVEAASDTSGYSPNEVHELLKAYALPHELAESGENGHLINGLVIGGSTARLNNLQFSEYLKRCAQFMAETWGVAVQERGAA